MRGGIKSDLATRRLALLHEENPWMFEPEAASRREPTEIAERLKSVGLNYNSKEIQRSWIENFRRLVIRWQGNPINIFSGINTYEAAQERIQNDGKGGGFLGFREKMVSMVTYFLGHSKLIDPFIFPVPVDFHIARIILANELVVVAESSNGDLYKPEVLDAIRALTIEYCRKHGVDPFVLCDALWLYSRAMCKNHPGNSSDVDRVRRGRGTPVSPKKTTWGKAQFDAFMRSCGRCVISETCRWCVPSGPYYIQGKLILRSPRENPPQLNQLHLFKT